jgi:Spy/CpxP family protein refolding chaperone
MKTTTHTLIVVFTLTLHNLAAAQTPPAPAARPAATPPASAARPAAAAPAGQQPAAPPKAAAAAKSPGESGCEHGDCPMMHSHGATGMMGPHAPHMGEPGEHMQMMEHLLDKLNVAEPVRKKIEDLLYDAKKRAITLRADADRAHLEVEHLLAQDLPDADAVMKQMDKAGQARLEMMKIWVKARLDAAKLLTPEQRAQLKQFMHSEMHDGPHGPDHAHGH